MGKLLILTPWYTPAFKAGGPIQSCIRLVAHLKANHTLQIITSGYDHLDRKPLPGILLDENHRLDVGVKIKYLSRGQFGVINMKREIAAFDPDYIYINGLFSKAFVIDVIWAHRWLKHRSGIILTVHGACKPSALDHKKFKKRIFLSLVKALGLHHNIKFHASNPEEKEEIIKVFGPVEVVVINSLPPVIDERVQYRSKIPGELDMIFVGRVHPIKNIHFVLQWIGKVNGNLNLKVVGAIEDTEYYKTCNTLISQLPSNVHVEFLGELPHQQIAKVLSDAHLFILSSLGENYGYAIIEALSAARPVLISDQTPWKNLKANQAGWELSLSMPGEWIRAVDEATAWDQTNFEAWCRGAIGYARQNYQKEGLVEKYQQLFI